MVKINCRKSVLFLMVYSCLFSASLIVGGKITIKNEPYFQDLTFSDYAGWVLLSIIIFILLFFVSRFLKEKINFETICPSSPKIWAVSAAIIFLAWLPYFLMHYPGILTPDSLKSVNQSLGVMNLNNSHPVMYTLFVKLIIKTGLLFGDLNFAVACYSIIQMAVMSIIFGYSVYWLTRKEIPGFVTVIVTIFYAVNPVIAMYSITMWKDIFFNGIMLLLFLFLLDMVSVKGSAVLNKKDMVKFLILCVLLAFTRNNEFLVLLATFSALTLYLKEHYKLLLPVFSGILIIIFVIQGPVYSMLDIGKSHFSEAVGIPLQQIAYTAKYGGIFTKEEVDFLNEIIPLDKMKEVYRPHIANEIKFDPEFNNEFLDANKTEFIKVWAKALPRNFSYYTRAYLMQTLGYYHVGTNNWVCRFKIDKNKHNLYNTDIIQNVVNVDLKRNVHKVIKNIHKLPVIGNVFNIASWIWLTFFCCIILYMKKRKELIIAFIPLISQWITVMTGTPAFCEFRYMLAFHYCLPFIIMLLFVKKSMDKAT